MKWKKIRNDFSLSPVASWQKADPILRLTVKTRSSWYLEFWASTGGTKLIDFIWKVAFLPSFSLSRDIKVPMVCTAPDLTSGTQCCEKSDQVKKNVETEGAIHCLKSIPTLIPNSIIKSSRYHKGANVQKDVIALRVYWTPIVQLWNWSLSSS